MDNKYMLLIWRRQTLQETAARNIRNEAVKEHYFIRPSLRGFALLTMYLSYIKRSYFGVFNIAALPRPH
jgi:hypothetical protein